MNLDMKNKPYKRLLLFVLIMVLVSFSCGYATEIRAPEAFPDTDIIFMAPNGIGFVNADGTSFSLLDFVATISYGEVEQAWRPVITADNQTIITKSGNVHFHASAPHALVMWRTNEFPVFCDNWSHQQLPMLTKDQKEIYIQFEQGIAVYALDSCGTKDVPMKMYEDMNGIFSPDLNFIAYVKTDNNFRRFIIIKNMLNEEEITVGEGDFPSWSFDSQIISYTGIDGIYIVNIQKSEKPRLLLRYLNPFDNIQPLYESNGYYQIPPEPSWSPDGKWLVYHKWIGGVRDYAFSPEFSTIYKINVETGEETKIIDGGMYPYWKWPVEEP